jgi:hypothetical protein
MTTHSPKNIPKPDRREEEGKISFLMNAIHFFLSRVFIIKNQGQYRLVAESMGSLVVDKKYPSIRGARIAFHKIFGQYHYDEDASITHWSHFYTPGKKWFDLRMSQPVTGNG